jgi:hypothetical protein
MRELDGIKEELASEPDGQLSLTDPDARSMTSHGKGTGIVGYNVQAAVDAKHHLIVAHEVTNVGSDRAQLSPMAQAAREAMGKDKLKAVADRGYYSGPQIKACHDAGIATILPKPTTSNAKAEGRFDKADFIYVARDDEYQCPAGQRAIYRFSEEDKGLLLRRYWSSACPRCPMKAQCTPSALPEDLTLGARIGPRGRATPTRQAAPGDDAAQTNGRTRLRDAETLDGLDALLDSYAGQCQHRNEPACAGLQPQESDEHPGVRQDDEGDEVARRVSAFA